MSFKPNIAIAFYMILSIFVNFSQTLFDQCNHVFNMKPGEKLYLNSPYYPANYPVGSSCRYMFKAPADYQVEFKCTIKLNAIPATSKCHNEIFYFNSEGSEVLTNSEYFCGTGIMERKSFLNQAVISYISTPINKRILPNVVKVKEVVKDKVNSEKKVQKITPTTTTRTTTVKPMRRTTLKAKIKPKTTKPTTAIVTSATRPTATTFQASSLVASALYPISFTSSLQSSIQAPSSYSLYPLAVSHSTSPMASSFSSLGSTATTLSDTPAQSIIEDIDVTNSFAYVVALLSNKNDKATFVQPPKHTASTTTTATSPVTAIQTTPSATYPSSIYASSSRLPTSVLHISGLDDYLFHTEDVVDALPVSTWRNGSISLEPSGMKTTHNSAFRFATSTLTPNISSTTTKRDAKVIVGKDLLGFISSFTHGLAATSTTPSTPLIFSNAASKNQTSSIKDNPTLAEKSSFTSTKEGGSFSCHVRVLEPKCDCGWSSTVKIAGASGMAGINEFPSMAGVMTKRNQKIFCGASIIHHNYLLSAAHCYITPETEKPENLQVVVGEHDLTTVLESIYTRYYDISSIIIHEQFRSTAMRVHNDIALLKTQTPIEWNRSVGPACLPFRLVNTAFNWVQKVPVAGQKLQTAGWGTTSFGGKQSAVLLKTTLDVISHDQCQNIIHYLPEGAFCTYTPGRDTCQYDSGGALYVRGERMYAVGIVSYGYACATNQPSVNTQVATYLNWIRNKTPGARYCVK